MDEIRGVRAPSVGGHSRVQMPIGTGLRRVRELEFFSSDYAAARRRFREGAQRQGWELSAYPIGRAGPDGEDLTIDVAVSAGDGCRAQSAVVVSSGLHGVEGFFGSAVQLALLERNAAAAPDAPRVVLLHGLNPYGFAWLRRVNENNVDLNRNFPQSPEGFAGSPHGYARIDRLLNPRRRPSRFDPLRLKLLPAVARHGAAGLRRIVAEGQYEFPQGLFYGGARPEPTRQIVAEHLPVWLGGATSVVHLDFHTGLGPWGSCQLLLDYPVPPERQAELVRTFPAAELQFAGGDQLAYTARGSWGSWCAAQRGVDYLYLCAEFGTYGSYRMLRGLRAENQLHHRQPQRDGSAATPEHWIKQEFCELYCPASAAWRRQAMRKAGEVIDAAIRMGREPEPGAR